MSSYNRITLMGRLGRDPDVRATGSGKKVASFSIATDNGYGENKSTDWHSITAWEKTAETAERFLKKGSAVLIEGRLTYEKYTNKQGVEVTAAKVVCDRIVLLPRNEGGGEQPRESSRGERASYPRNPEPAAPQGDDDGIPF